MIENAEKRDIEPLLDIQDRVDSSMGFIVKKPNGGTIVYMTPIDTVK